MRPELPGIREISSVPVGRLECLPDCSAAGLSERLEERVLRTVFPLVDGFPPESVLVFLPEIYPPTAPIANAAAGKIQGFFISWEYNADSTAVAP